MSVIYHRDVEQGSQTWLDLRCGRLTARMLRRDLAAAYCDLSAAGFLREVLNGTLPPSISLDGQEHWSRPLIDEYLERLTGQATPDWRKSAPIYARR